MYDKRLFDAMMMDDGGKEEEEETEQARGEGNGQRFIASEHPAQGSDCNKS